MISDRPFATLSLTEIGKLIPAYIKADSVEFLHDLQLEVYLRNTPDAEKLFQRIEKCLKCFEVPWHLLAFGKQACPRLKPHENTIFELEKLADEAMRLKRTSEILAIERLLALRSGPRARNLNNRITIYLWDEGMKPGLIPTARAA